VKFQFFVFHNFSAPAAVLYSTAATTVAERKKWINIGSRYRPDCR